MGSREDRLQRTMITLAILMNLALVGVIIAAIAST